MLEDEPVDECRGNGSGNCRLRILTPHFSRRKRARNGAAFSLMAFLRHFDQLHFAVFGAVQHHDFAFGIAEDKDVAILEVGLFDRFL
jgi:hypothetical protein